MSLIVHKELSYRLMGLLFKVHGTLGNRYQEKYYQRAVELELRKNNIKFQRELFVDLKYDGQKIGKYYLDFLIEDLIVLELKAVPLLLPKDFKQILAYLVANNLELGILANFGTDSLTYRRILNSKYKS